MNDARMYTVSNVSASLLSACLNGTVELKTSNKTDSVKYIQAE